MTLAGNQLLLTHSDSEMDSFNNMMNVLLQMPSAEAQHKYINTTLSMVRSVSNSNLGKILQDGDMFNALFELFKYNHFCSSCMAWQDGIQVMLGQFILMLDFLAAPVEFQDVSKDVPPSSDVLTAFEAKYWHLSSRFDKPISADAHQVLDDNMAKEKKIYCCQLAQYWDTLIMRSEVNAQLLPSSSTSGEKATTPAMSSGPPCLEKSRCHEYGIFAPQVHLLALHLWPTTQVITIQDGHQTINNVALAT
ncbi:hypothetical protein EDD17DRAFT_1510721 [Pisolithus thermaeus]|nr:hypothetical protein EV401DRAFT_1888112 [Pisolithus croceorrhizus]KAI6160176.1 hypothetical protein EDD17DRAFT_1510721 [Pisolithus thermaeus]